jgi:signal peptidase I
MMDVDAPSSNSMNSNVNTRDFFVVQKCWYSGPSDDVPTDYLRLLTTQQHAEEIACLSAHAFNSSSSGNSPTNNTNENKNAPVRTIVLPDGGGYAFLAAGKIFWVRRLQSSIVSTGHNANNVFNVTNSLMTAHAVVTEHVIGGTGNRNSRRGQEVATGRVFVGDGGASGQAAMVAAQQLTRVVGGAQGTMRVTWLPIGMPDENASNSNSHAHLQEWPDRHLWVQQHRQQYAAELQQKQQESCFKQQRDDSECSYYSVSHSHNASAHDDANHVFGTDTSNSMSTMDTNMFMAPPAAKRQCRQPDTVPESAAAFAAWPM